MPLNPNLPCPHCQSTLIVVYDKERQAKVCDCLRCGYNVLLKHYRAMTTNKIKK